MNRYLETIAANDSYKRMNNEPSGLQRVPATLRDVARAAGVSVASASRALSRQGGVSAELHARIMAAATRLGYQVNLAARALVSGRSGLIGVATPTLDPLGGAIVAALGRASGAAGYGMLLAVRGDSGDPAEATATLLGRSAEALIFVGTAPLTAERAILEQAELPWICVSDAAGEAPLTAGRQRGAALAAQYLLDLGHRRLAVIAPPGSGTRQGVVTALAGSGAGLVVPADADYGAGPQSVRGAIRAVLEHSPAPTAVVCGNDVEALAVLRECAIHGIAVPAGISIVGFGDQEFARHVVPALTTLRISAAALATQAVAAVMAGLRGEPMRPLDVPVKLVVRETTAPPAA